MVGYFMWVCTCVACVSLVLFNVRVFFSIDVCHHFPYCMLAMFPFLGGVADVVMSRACPGYWMGPPLCFVVVTACQQWGLLPCCWSRGPYISFKLCFCSVVQARWDWRIVTGKEATEYSFSGVVPLWVCSVVSPLAHYKGSQIILLLALLSTSP